MINSFDDSLICNFVFITWTFISLLTAIDKHIASMRISLAKDIVELNYRSSGGTNNPTDMIFEGVSVVWHTMCDLAEYVRHISVGPHLLKNTNEKTLRGIISTFTENLIFGCNGTIYKCVYTPRKNSYISYILCISLRKIRFISGFIQLWWTQSITPILYNYRIQ